MSWSNSGSTSPSPQAPTSTPSLRNCSPSSTSPTNLNSSSNTKNVSTNSNTGTNLTSNCSHPWWVSYKTPHTWTSTTAKVLQVSQLPHLSSNNTTRTSGPCEKMKNYSRSMSYCWERLSLMIKKRYNKWIQGSCSMKMCPWDQWWVFREMGICRRLIMSMRVRWKEKWEGSGMGRVTVTSL